MISPPFNDFNSNHFEVKMQDYLLYSDIISSNKKQIFRGGETRVQIPSMRLKKLGASEQRT